MARGGGASTRTAGAGNGLDMRAREEAARLWELRRLHRGGGDSDGRKKKGECGQTPTRCALFIGGSTGSARCGSFCRTIRTTTAIFRKFSEKITLDCSPNK
jgi:hypothetical protein